MRYRGNICHIYNCFLSEFVGVLIYLNDKSIFMGIRRGPKNR